MNPPLLIVAALKEEVRDLLKNCEIDRCIHLYPARIWEGEFRGSPLTMLVTGLGAERMRQGLQKAFVHIQPERAIHIGFAGSTSPLVTTGKLVLADRVVDATSGAQYPADADVLASAKNLADAIGGIVTVDRLISDPMEKAALGSEHHCLAVDMESAAVAAFCKERGLKCCIARSILDGLQVEIPEFETQAASGEPGVTDVLRWMIRHPREMLEIPRLQYLASQARNRLTQFVTEFLRNESTIVSSPDRPNV